MLATQQKPIAGGHSGVRAYYSTGELRLNKNSDVIEFMTKQKPTGEGRSFGTTYPTWSMFEGEYLPIQLERIFHPDGTVTIFLN